jgi:hypothetical protein
MKFKTFILFFLFFVSLKLYGGSPIMLSDTGLYRQVLCTSQLVLINGHLYDPNNPTGIEVLPGGGANGMDSVFRVELIFNSPVEVDYYAELCEFDTIYINNNPYHTGHYEDIEVFENGAANGCDSIVNVTLNFKAQPFRYIEDTLCIEQSLTINGNIYNEANPFGLEYVPSDNGITCDSILYISLRFRRAYMTLGMDQTRIAGDTACIVALTSTPPLSLTWSPNNVNCSDPICTTFCTYTLTDDFRLQATFVDTFGCVASASMTISVNNQHQIYSPNVIKIGSREPFDRFFLGADPGIHKIIRVLIYDRWGEPVYVGEDIPLDRSAAYEKAWDGSVKGQKAEPGVFTWWAEILTFDGKIIQKAGDITVIR